MQAGAMGENPTAAIDKVGRLHVVYGGDRIVYGVRASNGQWTWSPALAMGTNVGRSFSIAVDAADSPHVVYHNSTTFTLHHAFSSASGWQIEDVTPAESIGAGCDITFAEGALHVSSLSSNNNVWYSSKVGTAAWTSDEVAYPASSSVDANAATSIVVDRAKTASIVFSDLGTTNRLRVTYKTASATSWTSQQIEANGVGANPDAVVDPFDNIHVVYRTVGTSPTMRYAVGKTSTWSLAVQPVGLSGFQPSIAVEPEASVYMVSGDLGGVALTTHACN
jgi:hypothetical protein